MNRQQFGAVAVTVAVGASALCTFLTPAHASPVTLAENERYQTADDNGKTISCGLVEGEWVSGVFARSDQSRFTPLTTTLKNLRKNLKKASGSKKTALQKRVKTFRQRIAVENPLCVENAPSGTDGGTTPTPTPTPTPVGGGTSEYGALFDAQGNVTAAGKLVLQIPAGIEANAERGRTQYTTRFCVGCHVTHTAARTYQTTFPALKTIVGGGSMQITMPDQDMADITAFFNRLRNN